MSGKNGEIVSMQKENNSGLNRSLFPKDFIFGTGTSAFQVEGAATKGGRGLSIWDDFSMRFPGKITDGSNGTLACDVYHRYQEDIKMMKQMGFDSCRFSISWTRILPSGRCSGGINREGIDYYNDVINTVIANSLNYYTAKYVAHDSHPHAGIGYPSDQKIDYIYARTVGNETIPIGTPSGSPWLHSVPTGIYNILTFLDKEYPELKEIYITENGTSTKSDFQKTAKMVCEDEDRTKYLQDHLFNIIKAMTKGNLKNKLKGYYVWSWLDNYEWSDGYTIRFGIVYVDYMNGLTRYPKNSAAWLSMFLKSNKEPQTEPWFPLLPVSFKKRSVEEEDGENEAADKRLKLVEAFIAAE